MDTSLSLNKFFNTIHDKNDSRININNIIESPYIWIGTCEKLILNYLNFSIELINFFKNSIPDLDEEKIKIAGKEIVCNKAYGYLNKLELNNPIHLDSLKIRSSNNLLLVLNYLLEYFELIEDYEKCCKIRDIFNQIKHFIKQKIDEK